MGNMAVCWLVPVPVLLLVVPSYDPVLGGKVDMTGFNSLLRVSNSNILSSSWGFWALFRTCFKTTKLFSVFTAIGTKIKRRTVPKCYKFLTTAEDSKPASFWGPSFDLGQWGKFWFF
jgi:hypothetical protein